MRKLALVICLLIVLVNTSACIIKPEIHVITDQEDLNEITNVNLEEYGIHTNNLNISEIVGFVPTELTSSCITSALTELNIGSDRYIIMGEDVAASEVMKIQYGDDFYMIFTKYSTVEAAHEAFIYNFYNDVIYWEENNLFDGNIRRIVTDSMGYFTLNGTVGAGVGPSEFYYGAFYQYDNIALMVLNNGSATDGVDNFLALIGLEIPS